MIKLVNIKKKLRTWIEIDKKAIKSNYKTFRKIAKGMKLMGVVKSNAYGHGLFTISTILQNLTVDFLGVDSIVEANALTISLISSNVFCPLPSVSMFAPLCSREFFARPAE